MYTTFLFKIRIKVFEQLMECYDDYYNNKLKILK